MLKLENDDLPSGMVKRLLKVSEAHASFIYKYSDCTSVLLNTFLCEYL